MGVLITCIGAGPVGVLALGFLAERQGALTVMSATGLATIAVAAWLWPELTHALADRPLARARDS